MNFLAHCLIAEEAASASAAVDAAPLIAGGLLADFIKGPVPQGWPEALQQGVRLHRRIDAFSNCAPAIRRSVVRFPAPLRRLAPVFVDVIADHCLALDWAAHHSQPLPVFSARCYVEAQREAHRLSRQGRRRLAWMVSHDLLSGNRSRQGMERGLLSITRRLGRQHLDAVLLDFVSAELPSLKGDFQRYMPLLLAHGRQWARTQEDAT